MDVSSRASSVILRPVTPPSFHGVRTLLPRSAPPPTVPSSAGGSVGRRRQTGAMANYSVDYLKRLNACVIDFESAFETWMDTQVETDHLSSRGLFPTVWTKDGEDEAKVRKLELAVAEAAGPASSAVSVTGSYIAVQGIGVIDPIANWSMMRNPKALLTPREVRTVAATVRGRLAALITDAEAAATTDVPAFSPALMHPVVWAGAAAHWTSHQYR